MTSLRMAAVTLVTAALAFYTVGTVKEQRSRRATVGARGFLVAGVCFDITSTILMVLATERKGITLHGILGYSALAAMSLDTWLLWRHARREAGEEVPRGLHLFSRTAYIYWVVAYFTGAALVMMAQRA